MKQIYRLLKINHLIKSPRIKLAGILAANLLGLRHLIVRLDPFWGCNLRCVMCYLSDEKSLKQPKTLFTADEIDRLAEMFFPRALQLAIGCGAEPTLYRNFPRLIALGRKYRIPFIGLVTNGQLIKEPHVHDFIDNQLNEIIISTHGVHKATYETLMVGAKYDVFLHTLEMISAIKKGRHSTNPALRINYTVNPDNLAELKDFFPLFGKYEIAILQIRPLVDFKGAIYAKKDLGPYISQYNETIARLAEQCKSRGIIFLANKIDPLFNASSMDSIIFDNVVRNITPYRIWKDDFDWEKETYAEYCRRTRWRKTLFFSIFKNKKSFLSPSTNLKFDINF
jgi:MoaA/NifB/PqqE/SkfB family radical SAM enzyme